MKTKLILQIDKKLVQNAQDYAQRKDTTLSAMVSDYFSYLLAKDKRADLDVDSLPPITRSLIGRFKGTEVDEDDHRRHLEKKYK